MLDPVVAMLDEALDHMQAGRPAAAEVLCHRVLATGPDQTLALHMAGVAALRQGRAADAAPWLRRAVALRPDDAALAVLDDFRVRARLGDVFQRGIVLLVRLRCAFVG